MSRVMSKLTSTTLHVSTWQKVFLREPHDSKKFSTDKYTKLFICLGELFIVLTCFGSSACRLNFPRKIEINLVFHVSHLKNV